MHHVSCNVALNMDCSILIPSQTETNRYQMSTIPVAHSIYKDRLSAYQCKRKSQSTRLTAVDHIKPKIKLCEATNEIKECYDMIESLRMQTNDMIAKIDLSSFDWSDTVSKINSELGLAGKRVDGLIHNRDDIQTSSRKRQQKRNRIKLGRSLSKHWRQLEVSNRNEKSHTIDEWLEKAAENEIQTRQRIRNDECLQRSVRGIGQKIAYATKQLALLESLQMLHVLRERGKSMKHDSNKTFSTDIDELKSMWTVALNTYKAEENKQRESFNTHDPLNEWCVALFSQNMLPANGDDKIDQLIAHRRLWDEFGTSKNNNFASSIPIGWIMPPSKPLQTWSVYRNA